MERYIVALDPQERPADEVEWQTSLFSLQPRDPEHRLQPQVIGYSG